MSTFNDQADPEVPAPGQVVQVRGGTWAVVDVTVQGLPISPADDAHAGLNHVVSLQSLDDDRMGQELQVVWQLEVGNSVRPSQSLPEAISADGFDDPNRLAAFVDAVRWGAVTSADPKQFQAPYRSGATVEPYQLEPLRRALESPRTNLLLADDVGLGKTIEAGLVIQELLLRHRARTAIIVCPPSLSVKWRDEMLEKFGLEFTIVDSACMAETRRTHGLNANPLRLFPRVIVSMAWLPQVRAQRLLRDVYEQVSSTKDSRSYAFDILVVDEAHHVAPASPSTVGKARGYAVDSQRTIATRALAEKCEHRLFLSATPHNGHTESFTALLEMIDNRRFARGAAPSLEAVSAVTVRRLKSQIKDKDFKARSIMPLPYEPSGDEVEMYESLEKILLESARLSGQKNANDIQSLLLKKRFLSSPYSFGRTLELYQQANSARQYFDFEIDDYYAEVLGEHQSDEEEGLANQPEAMTLKAAKHRSPLASAQPEQLQRMIDWGLSFELRRDAKLTALVNYLNAQCRIGETWSNERVVVFTEYAETVEWLQRVLESQGYQGRLEVIQGSTPSDERERIKAEFNASPVDHPVRVLLATDSAGEGIDLQQYCHRLVNYDLPFNPSRLEQRIGRIDRYGQAHSPQVLNLVPEASQSLFTAHANEVNRIMTKVIRASAELGSINHVIERDLRGALAGGPASLVETSGGEPLHDSARIINEALRGEQELNRVLTDLAHSYEADKKSMHLTPENSRRVIDAALALTNQPLLERVGDDRTDAEVFEISTTVSPAWQHAAASLATVLSPEWRPLTFDENAARGRQDLVHVHLGHALMTKASRTLRNALFSASSQMNRVTAFVVPGLEESCVAAVSRLVLVGKGGLRLHEEVFLTGVKVKGQAVRAERLEELVDSFLDAQGLSLASERLRAALVTEWNGASTTGRMGLRRKLLNAMEAKAEVRLQRVQADLNAREASDIERVRGIFAEFETNLRTSLRQMAEQENVLFGFGEDDTVLTFDEQRRQFERDRRAMEQRLPALEAERERELNLLRRRYQDVKPHISAAGVIFALTEADAQAGEIR